MRSQAILLKQCCIVLSVHYNEWVRTSFITSELHYGAQSKLGKTQRIFDTNLQYCTCWVTEPSTRWTTCESSMEITKKLIVCSRHSGVPRIDNASKQISDLYSSQWSQTLSIFTHIQLKCWKLGSILPINTLNTSVSGTLNHISNMYSADLADSTAFGQSALYNREV